MQKFVQAQSNKTNHFICQVQESAWELSVAWELVVGVWDVGVAIEKFKLNTNICEFKFKSKLGNCIRIWMWYLKEYSYSIC